MSHLEEWERKGGQSPGQRGLRNVTVAAEDSFICEVAECGKTCKSKAVLTLHRKRIHEVLHRKLYSHVIDSMKILARTPIFLIIRNHVPE